MKLEKINDNKIRAYFDLIDLEKNNIDFQSFMANSPKSEQFYLNVLNIAKEKFNFSTDNYQVLIETSVTDSGNFICNLTRYIKEFQNKDFKKISLHNSSNVCIYSFSTFNNYVNFCYTLNQTSINNINIFSNCSKLFLFNNIYYLVLQDVTFDLNTLESFCACISEFGNYMTNSKYFLLKLSEYGKKIIPTNAIVNVL